MRFHAILLIALIAQAAAGDVNVRIDVDGIGSRIQLTGSKVMPGSSGSAFNASWLREESQRPCFLISQFTIPRMVWTEVAFTFTPSASGKVTLILRSPWKPKPGDFWNSALVPVTFDNVRAEGATLLNGSFETPGTKRQIAKGWTHSTFSEYPRLVFSPLAAQDGEKAVEVWHNYPISQVMTVQASLPVTIRAWAWYSFPDAP